MLVLFGFIRIFQICNKYGTLVAIYGLHDWIVNSFKKGVITVAKKKGSKNEKLKEKDKRKKLAKEKQKIEAQAKR